MDRKIFGFLSGWQFTVLASVAIITPGTVYAVATQAVSITDPGTGKQSYVDNARRLSVYDPIAGYRNFPANFVHFDFSCGDNYAPPSGKALIVTAVNLAGLSGQQGGKNILQIYDSDTFAEIAVLSSVDAYATESVDLGTGAIVYAGDTIHASCAGFTDERITVNGYLAPSGLLPPRGTPEALAQFPPGRHRP